MTPSQYYYNQAANASPNVPQTYGIPGRGMNPAMPMSQSHFMQQAYRNAPAPMVDHRKRVANKSSRQSMPLVEDTEEPSGDELDDISSRDIAMARYKRNHDYLSEIFTPYNAASIVPPPIDVSHNKEELSKLINELEDKLKQRQTEHDEKIAKIKRTGSEFWKRMEELNKAQSLESIDKAVEDMSSWMDVKVDHVTTGFRTVPIPGIEEDEEEKPQKPMSDQNEQMQTHDGGAPGDFADAFAQSTENTTAQDDDLDMFTTFEDQNMGGEEAGSDLFNEMVNAQDDDGVSEFLNTSGMDFESENTKTDEKQD
ncbi:uncharacterized protein BYT42DRAFT_570065 [Radiomyces spectabilis]|uniref:uncharacterized protein n=1 Tax=Radiomyces spectabilis TaxID=64574 RepID=UPI002220C9DD|nr:uncharacterized protein BYT42DRAFT_570065 [Radiomyces spectabilis]KAI8379800.1 hypothetical protein BYT42DRAFT_570065 [Radiomyces spectabilis]